MVTRITRIGPLQLGKVLAAMYALVAVVFIPFLLLAILFAPEGEGPGTVWLVLMPVLYISMGAIGGILGAFIYNFCARWVGGIEIELGEPAEDSVAY